MFQTVYDSRPWDSGYWKQSMPNMSSIVLVFLHCSRHGYLFFQQKWNIREICGQWHPPLMRHFSNFWPFTDLDLITEFDFFIIVWGFHRTFATGAACQQRTLTPPDTWSCPTLGLACVLMSRPISPEIVLFPDFWVSDILRNFCFAWEQ